MMLPLLIVLVLAAVVWQDFRSRAVYWWIFPLLAGLCIFWRWSALGGFGFVDSGINIIFLAVQLLVLTGYLSWRKGRLVAVWDGFLGLGDISLLLAVAFLLPFTSFLFFYLATLFFSVLLSACLLWVSRGVGRSIPLAGEQAAILGLWILADVLLSQVSVFREFDWGWMGGVL